MCILHVHPHGVTCLGCLVAQVTVLRREDNVLSFYVSLYVKLIDKTCPTYATRPASRLWIFANVDICKIFELFK